MARFLTTAQSASEIEIVIQEAKTDLYIVSPYIKLSERYRRRLTDANERGVHIHVACRIKDLDQKQKEALAPLENLTLYDDPKLHAKSYASERGVVVTSLNLYESSEGNSEMGVRLDAADDRAAFADATREIASVFTHATPVPFSSGGGAKTSKARGKPSRKSKVGRVFTAGRKAKTTPEQGHCIRCGTGTDYNPKKPYCGRCFRQWLRFKNPTYADDRCHGCGAQDENAFTLEKPECYACYKRNAKAITA